MAAMLSQMMGAITQPAADGQANPMAQMMQGLMGHLQGAGSNASAGAPAGAPAAAGGEPMLESVLDLSEFSGPLGDVLRLVAAKLTMNEAIQVMQGNWTPMEKVREAMGTYLRDLLNGDLSEANTRAFSSSVVQTLAGTMTDSTLPESITSHVKAGHSVTRTALQVSEEQLPGMIRLVCSSDGGSFALAVRAWTTNFVGSLMEKLVLVLDNGEEGALAVVQHFVTARVAQLRPEMAPMVGGMLRSSVARIYQEYRLSRRGIPSQEASSEDSVAEREEEEEDVVVDDDDIAVPSVADMEIEQAGWQDTVRRDVERQRTLPEQRPFSDAYQEGMPPQKRKKATDTEMAPEDLLQRRVQEAAASSDVLQGDSTGQRELVDAALQPPVAGLYVQQLAADLRHRLRTDPDFDRSQFPNAARLLDEEA